MEKGSKGLTRGGRECLPVEPDGANGQLVAFRDDFRGPGSFQGGSRMVESRLGESAPAAPPRSASQRWPINSRPKSPCWPLRSH